MTPTRKASDRLYTKGGRWYADFRDLAQAGGRLEALIPQGAHRATEDRAVAVVLAARRLEALQQKRAWGAMHGAPVSLSLAKASRDYLVDKKAGGAVTDVWLGVVEAHLRRAVAFFGGSQPLEAIGVADVKRWAAHLRSLKGQDGRLTDGTIRHHLNALSRLFAWAAESEGQIRYRSEVVEFRVEQHPGAL